MVFLAACEKAKDENSSSGYIDADYVYISAPSSDKIKAIYAVKGSSVMTGDKLFELENYKANSMFAANKFMDLAMQSYIEDMRKGARQEQIDEWKYIQIAVKEMIIFMQLESKMFKFLSEKNASADQYWWFTRQMQYSLTAMSKAVEMHQKYIELGQRPDKITAFEMANNAAKSMIPYTQYQLSETIQYSPCDAFVFDIFYRKGELPGAGRPVIQLLPNENLKAVFYVKGTYLDKIKIGGKVKIYFNEASKDFIESEVNYISPNVQYTDPLIYSLKNNEKLLYSVEAKIPSADISKLHPGEVVSVEF
jgi:HlyD family secretion protein